MTTAKQINIAPVSTYNVVFDSGVNEAVSSIEMKPGDLLAVQNYYITEGVSSGYVSLSGYEIYDGQPAPSAQVLVAGDDTLREARRTAILDVGTALVVCEGPVLGIYVFEGVLYAFRNKLGGATAGMFKETATGWEEVDTSANPLAPGGVYSFITYNFKGTATGNKMWWANGVDKARSYDGTTVRVMDNVGMDPNDKPEFIASHADCLWLTYPGGSAQHSTIGMDHNLDNIEGTSDDWEGLNGAGYWDVGGDITAIKSTVGGTLVFFGRDFIKTLTTEGTEADWVMKTFSDALGAYPYTVDKLFDTLIFMSDMGITTLSSAQEFGDFGANTISEKVKRTLFRDKALITCAVTIKRLNQYRIYFSNGTGIIFSYYNKKLKGATFIKYPNPVYTVTEGMDTAGDLQHFFTSVSGKVYHADIGTSFDGAEIAHSFSTAYFHYGSPRNWKRFYRLTFEIESIDTIIFSIRAGYDYGGAAYPTAAERQFTVDSQGDNWDEGLWDEMIWSGGAVANRIFYDLMGIGSNMNISVRYASKYASHHTFQNMIVDFQQLGRQM